MITILKTSYLDQTQAIGLNAILEYSGIGVPLEDDPLLFITLTESVEYDIALSGSIEYNIILSEAGGGT